jgi:hypothetical protein
MAPDPIFQLAYEINPIILIGGIASGMVGNSMPISNLTQINGQEPTTLDQYFCRFKPIPGGTLQNWQIANYPFANSIIAANASIAQPLSISLEMRCPSNESIPLSSRQAVFNNLASQLTLHITQGGTFTVLTPSYTYQNCLMVNMRDITANFDMQTGTAWALDFIQPLITQQSAQQSVNGLYSKLANQTVVNATDTNSGAGAITNLAGAVGTQ